MRRREFLTLLGGAVAASPLNGLAQTPPKPPLIGFLMQNSTAASEASRSGFAQGMRELGYLENRDYVLEERYAGGDRSRLPPLAEELVRLKPELMVVGGLPAPWRQRRQRPASRLSAST
jgi:putative tryptophan/tyrosine transport system substrate-binding protein